MTDDEQLDQLLGDAERHYHRPPPAPLDAMWQAVEAEAFAPTVPRRLPWQAAGLVAASLLVGVFAGRLSKGGAAPPVATVATTDSTRTSVDRATQQFLGQTAILLAALPSERDSAPVDPTLAADGRRLLVTTRVLLDSHAADNDRIRNLLLDLELVLAQVARLQHQRAHDELIFIQSALDERDIVPRMQAAVVDLSSGSL